MVTSIQLNQPDSTRTRWTLFVWLSWWWRSIWQSQVCQPNSPVFVNSSGRWVGLISKVQSICCVTFISLNLHLLHIWFDAFKSLKGIKLFWKVLLCFDILRRHLQQANLHLNTNDNFNFIFVINNDIRKQHCLQERSVSGSGKDNSLKYEHFRWPLPRFLSLCMWSCWKADISIDHGENWAEAEGFYMLKSAFLWYWSDSEGSFEQFWWGAAAMASRAHRFLQKLPKQVAVSADFGDNHLFPLRNQQDGKGQMRSVLKKVS